MSLTPFEFELQVTVKHMTSHVLFEWRTTDSIGHWWSDTV